MPNENHSLDVQSIDRRPGTDSVDTVVIQTSAGPIDCRLHTVDQPDPAAKDLPAVIWVGGAGGGLTGPARGMYPRLAAELARDGIASLRVDYRRPNDLIACVLDTLAGEAYLETLGFRRNILVGHSFGGAVVITAGAQTDAVIGVITLASQNADTELASELAPRALFCLHGTADTVLPNACSRDIFDRAHQPKRLEIYPGCGHGFDQCIESVDRDILGWIRELVFMKE